MQTRQLTIANPRGLHAEACARLVAIARRYRCKVFLVSKKSNASAHATSSLSCCSPPHLTEPYGWRQMDLTKTSPSGRSQRCCRTAAASGTSAGLFVAPSASPGSVLINSNAAAWVMTMRPRTRPAVDPVAYGIEGCTHPRAMAQSVMHLQVGFARSYRLPTPIGDRSRLLAAVRLRPVSDGTRPLAVKQSSRTDDSKAAPTSLDRMRGQVTAMTRR